MVLIAVRSYRMCTGTLKYRSAKRCISTCIKVNITVKSCKYTVFITAECECTVHCMTLRMESKRLVSTELCLYRSVKLISTKCGYMLSCNILFSAESASYKLILNNHLLRIPTEHDCHFFSGIKYTLV